MGNWDHSWHGPALWPSRASASQLGRSPEAPAGCRWGRSGIRDPGHTASLTLAVAVLQSTAILQAQLRHTFPALQALPPETSLAIQLGQEAGHWLGLKLRAGACKLQGVGELQLDRGLWWRVLAQSSCKALQVGGAGVGGRGGHQSLQRAGQGPSFQPLAKQGRWVNPSGMDPPNTELLLCTLQIEP